MTDQEITEDIWSRYKRSKRTLRTGQWGLNRRTPRNAVKFVDLDDPEETYQCCAVGAGLLFRGLARGDSFYEESPCSMFAEAYGVSIEYAVGVSDGFEDALVSRDNDDYTRGLAVGAEIAERRRAEECAA